MSIQSLTLVVCLFVTTLSANAEIYRSTDAEGNVIYTDQPLPGAKTVDLPGLTSYESPAYSTSTPAAADTEAQPTAVYTEFSISKPANDETIRDNTGEVRIAIAMSPALKPGHVVVLNMDGQIYKGNTTQYTLQNVDRGTHELQAHIEDASGEKQTEVVSRTFHLKRFSILNKPSQ